MRKQIAWNVWAWVAAALAAWAARRATTMVWVRLTDGDDPVDPVDGGSSWGEAAAWAVIAGVIAATARVLARRGAGEAWEAVTGEAPPGV